MGINYINKNKAQLVVDYSVNGKRHRKTKVVQISGKKDAQEQYREFLSVFSAAYTDVSVSLLVRTYIKHQESIGIKATTIKGYYSCMRRLERGLGNITARDLRPLQIEMFINNLSSLSPKTIKNTISLLSSAYKYAIRKDELNNNPCDKVQLPKLVKKEISILSEDEISGFIESLKDDVLDFKVLCELALFCGLRLSEILAITYDDINYNFKTISINKSRHRVNGKDIIQTPKTVKSNRVVAVPDFVLDDIKNLEHITDCDYLIQYCGSPMRTDYAVRRMSVIRKKYGYNITIHGLRHTYASILHKSGKFDLAEISAALGHANISTTLNIYTHIMGSALNSQKRIADHFNNVSVKNGTKMAQTKKAQ